MLSLVSWANPTLPLEILSTDYYHSKKFHSMLTARSRLCCLVANSSMILTWSLHVPPCLRASKRPITSKAWSQPPNFSSLYHSGLPPFWRHLQLSAPITAIAGFRRALPTNTGNNLQRTIQAHDLSTTRIYVIAPDCKAFITRANTEVVEAKKENVHQHLQDTSNRQLVNSSRWLKSPREVWKSYQTPDNVENSLDLGTGRALPSMFTAIHIARYLLIAVLLWNYGPRPTSPLLRPRPKRVAERIESKKGGIQVRRSHHEPCHGAKVIHSWRSVG